jgi:hypothetical protein
MKLLIIPCLLVIPSCTAQQSPPASTQVSGPILHRQEMTIGTRFDPPRGFTRIAAAGGSYGFFLRNLPLKPHGASVHYYDGREKPNPGIYAAVLNMDIGAEDLQQCADAVMRLRAEYLYSTGQRRAIHFRFTSGFPADYVHWQQGYRIAVAGPNASWVKRAAPADDYASFRKYMNVVFSYAGTRSLAAELARVAFRDMQIGDVFIVGGSPGHAVTVMDMAQNAEGKKVYLLSQSYMPAQDIQILCNPDSQAISPWYELPASEGAVHTPQWDFTTGDLKRFAN